MKKTVLNDNSSTTLSANESWDNVQGALVLNGDPNRLNAFYEKWADTYDKDVRHEQYIGPKYIVSYLNFLLNNNHLTLNPNQKSLEILDAGCGTGLVGFHLRESGFNHVDGFDLSEAMVSEARQMGAYRNLIGSCDMTSKIPAYQNSQYDVTICCGVFTRGHVPPESLRELVRLTKPEGLVLVSTRKSYYESTEFRQVWEQLRNTDQIKLVACVMQGPYLAEEDAQYWAFKVSKKN